MRVGGAGEVARDRRLVADRGRAVPEVVGGPRQVGRRACGRTHHSKVTMVLPRVPSVQCAAVSSTVGGHEGGGAAVAPAGVVEGDQPDVVVRVRRVLGPAGDRGRWDRGGHRAGEGDEGDEGSP